MSKLYVIAAISFFSILGFSSCEKESETNAIPSYLQNSRLTGKWYLKALYTRISTDTSINVTIDTASGYSTSDYFDFKENNAATYSSTIIGKTYQGYYSANSSVVPETLKFKSGDFLEKFNISTISKDSLVLYKTDATTYGLVTRTVASYYIYTH